MRIVHLSFSAQGGAGKVASLLAKEQAAQGASVKFLYQTEGSLWGAPLALPQTTAKAAFDNFVLKKRRVQTQVSITRSTLVWRKIEALLVEPPDVLHLHWVEGLISPHLLSRFRDRGTKIFWTLHDMRPFTGGCHQSLGCRGFEMGCQKCPQVRFFADRQVRKAHSDRFSEIADLGIKFIAPSNWIADSFRQSSFGQFAKVERIANPIDASYFNATPEIIGRKQQAVFIANRLADPLKGFADLAQEFEKNANIPQLLAIGNTDGVSTSSYRNVSFAGQLSSAEISETLSNASFLVMNSKSETAPLVVAEAAAKGVIPVIPEAIAQAVDDHLLRAGILQFRNLSVLSRILDKSNQAREGSVSKALHEAAFRVHSPTNVARTYMDAYAKN